MKPFFPVLFVGLLTILPVHADFKKLKYNENYSVKELDERLDELLTMSCDDFGLKNLNQEDDVQLSLDSYPKEILFRYFSQNHQKICFYNYEMLTKRLIIHFRSQIIGIYLKNLKECVESKNQTQKFCARDKEIFYIDTASILGQVCNQDAFVLMQKINCQYREFKENKCTQLKYKSLIQCPDYQNYRVEIKSLHEQFSSQCKSLKWRSPKCLIGI